MSIIWWTAGVSGIDAPAIFGDARPPDAAGDDDRLGLDVALVRADPLDVAVLDVEPGDLDAGNDRERAQLLGLLAHQRAGLERVDDARRRACRSPRG